MALGVFDGILNPTAIMQIITIICVWEMVEAIKLKDKANGWKTAALILYGTIFLVWLGMSALEISIDFFYYFGIAITSTITSFIYQQKKQRLPLLIILAFYSILYIGIGKTKYETHLALILPLAIAYILNALYQRQDAVLKLLRIARII